MPFLYVLQSARGQNPDICIVDEAAFVSASLLVSVMPLMTVKGTKQIHISSPGQPNSWITQVGDIKQDNGETLAQVIDCKYKCKSHATTSFSSGYRPLKANPDDDISCSCYDIYRPDHIKIEHGVGTLMNMVSEGSFETELTGGHTLAIRPENHPFEVGASNFLLTNVPINHPLFSSPDESCVVIAVDPTWSTGTVSSIGICAAIHTSRLGMPRMIVFGLDEVDISDHILSSSKLHESVVKTHIMVCKLMFPKLPICFLIEANTYCEPSMNLWVTISNWALKSNVNNLFCYVDREKDKQNSKPGKLIGRNKLSQMLNFADALKAYKVGRADVVYSVGQMVLQSFTRRLKLAETESQYKQTHTSLSERMFNKDTLLMSDNVTLGEDKEQLLFAIAQHLDSDPFTVRKLLFNFTSDNLNKLMVQMRRVKVTSDHNNQPVLDTGGKKRTAGTYTKDDILSAFFLNHLITDELNNPDNRIWPSL